MRAWWRTAPVGVLIVALGGCGVLERASEPAASAAAPSAARAAAVVPKAGVCHRSADPVSYASTYAPVECTATHRAETVSVHRFAGAPAALPAAGSPTLRAAFGDCDDDVRAFVGADWRGGNMSVQVVTPSPVDWAGGSRWFRCDVFQIVRLDGGSTRRSPDDHPVERTSSLAGALRSPSALSYDCFDENAYEQLQPVPCTRPHRFEYAGVWTTTYADLAAVEKNADRVHEHCTDVMVARARRQDRRLVGESGTAYRTPSPEAWSRGDRGIRCLLWHDDRPRSRSVLADASGAVGA